MQLLCYVIVFIQIYVTQIFFIIIITGHNNDDDETLSFEGLLNF